MSVNMDKYCRKCEVVLTTDNRSGKRLFCKPCRVLVVMEYKNNNRDKVNARVRKWMHETGRVKSYPCETCSIPCYKKYTRALCSDKCRFFSHIKKTDGCWMWQKYKDRSGYGKAQFKGKKYTSAHRWAYELFIGPIPDGKFVCHSCDNTSCVNPSHLWIGTTQDNKKDQVKKGRAGIKLRESDVMEIRDLHSKGSGSQHLAYLYKVTCGTISSIIKRRIWKHI